MPNGLLERYRQTNGSHLRALIYVRASAQNPRARSQVALVCGSKLSRGNETRRKIVGGMIGGRICATMSLFAMELPQVELLLSQQKKKKKTTLISLRSGSFVPSQILIPSPLSALQIARKAFDYILRVY